MTSTNRRAVRVDDLTTDQLLDVMRAKSATVPVLDWITKSGRDYPRQKRYQVMSTVVQSLADHEIRWAF